MSLVAENVATAVLLHHLMYCSARCKANPLTASFATPLDAALSGLLAMMEARNTASNKTIVSGAARDYGLEVLTDLFVPIGQRLAAAHGGSRTAPGYLRIFGKSPSELANTPQWNQIAVFTTLQLALQDPETPKSLGDDVKAFTAAFTALKTAIANDDSTENQLVKAIGNVGKARVVALDALATVDADLRKVFPRQRKKVAVFFPKVAKKAGKSGAAGAADEPSAAA